MRLAAKFRTPSCPALLLLAALILYCIRRRFRKIPQVPQDRLRKCADNVWVLYIPPPYDRYGRTMVVYKSEKGEIYILNPVPYVKKLGETVRRLGKLTHVILMNKKDMPVAMSWKELNDDLLIYTNYEPKTSIRGSVIRSLKDLGESEKEEIKMRNDRCDKAIKVILLKNMGTNGRYLVSITAKDGFKILVTSDEFVEATNTIGKLPPFTKPNFKIKGPISAKRRTLLSHEVEKLDGHDILIPGRGIGIYNIYSVSQYLQDGKNSLLRLDDKHATRWSNNQLIYQERLNGVKEERGKTKSVVM